MLLVGTGGGDTFYWTPLGIGLVYLAASIAGGRNGGYWSGALVLCGWGAAVAYAATRGPTSTSRACTSPAQVSVRPPRSPRSASASAPIRSGPPAPSLSPERSSPSPRTGHS